MQFKNQLLIGVLVFLFSSCAIHAGFPFFCFKKQCIKEQWSGTRKEAGGKLSFKKRAEIFFNKQQRKRQRSKKSNESKPPISWEEVVKGDTLKAEEYIRITIRHKSEKDSKEFENDSSELKSSFLVLSKNEKQILDYYLQKYPQKKITNVWLRTVLRSDTTNDQNKRSAVMKMKRVAHYLEKNKVRKSKIMIVK